MNATAQRLGEARQDGRGLMRAAQATMRRIARGEPDRLIRQTLVLGMEDDLRDMSMRAPKGPRIEGVEITGCACPVDLALHRPAGKCRKTLPAAVFLEDERREVYVTDFFSELLNEAKGMERNVKVRLCHDSDSCIADSASSDLILWQEPMSREEGKPGGLYYSTSLVDTPETRSLVERIRAGKIGASIGVVVTNRCAVTHPELGNALVCYSGILHEISLTANPAWGFWTRAHVQDVASMPKPEPTSYYERAVARMRATKPAAVSKPEYVPHYRRIEALACS